MLAGRFAAGLEGLGRCFGLAILLGVLGCDDRERLTFTAPPIPGQGPRTFIDRPRQDTTVTAGPDFLILGLSRDANGVDTVYFETVGGVSNFPPFHTVQDTVQWGLPLTTLNQSGVTVTLRVFAVDYQGNRGDTAIRRISIQ